MVNLLESMSDEELITFNTLLAKELKKLKKDLRATTIKQGYRGTGSKKYKRQIFVKFSWDARGLDIWLEAERVVIGGVIAPIKPIPNISYSGKSPGQVYSEILKILKSWKNSKSESTLREDIEELKTLATEQRNYNVRGKAQNAIMRILDQGGGDIHLNDLAAMPELRGVHYARILSALKFLGKSNKISWDERKQIASIAN